MQRRVDSAWKGKPQLLVAVLIFLFLPSCLTEPLIGPLYNDSKEVTAEDGTVFTVLRRIEDFPDLEIMILVTHNGEDVFYEYGLGGVVSEYSYEYDFVKNWYQIKKEYHTDTMDAYQFNWGIVYTTDDGSSYSGIPKHEYKEKQEEDEVFAGLLEALQS